FAVMYPSTPMLGLAYVRCVPAAYECFQLAKYSISCFSVLTSSEKARKYLPSMKGRPLGDVELMNLGTHKAGGFPLQVTDEVKT
ncbi:hypothetical protein ACC668_37700, partial [Rhizobium ruizarguesonis]